MKKKWQKVLSTALLSTALVATLAACGSGDGTSDSGGGKKESGKSGDKVTLKVPVYDRGVEGVPNVTDNYWTKYVQENFGDPNDITVEYVAINRQDVMTDYSLLASSKDLPTILMEYDYPKVSQWANEGYLATFDMDDFKEAAPNYYAQMEAEGQMDYTKMNDETYFVLGNRPNWSNGFNFQQFYRKDWLEEVGVDEYPNDYEGWKDAMIKIQDKGLAEHPAGGQMIPGQGADIPWIFMDHPIDEENWASYVSAVIPALGFEPSEELLKRENEKYDLGLLDPEYYLTDEASAQAKFANGESFVFGGYISNTMDWLKTFYENNPDAELGIVPPAENDEKAETSATYMADNPYGMIVGFASTASDEEVQAAWKYLDWMADEENLKTMQWGVEGENYTINEETGLPESDVDYDGDKKQGYNNNTDYWCAVTASRVVGELEDQIDAIAPKGLPQSFNDEILANTNRKEELAKEGYAVNFPAFTVPIEAETENAGTLTETYKELRDKLVMAKPADFDKLYEEYTKKYEDAGFKDVTEERLQAYKDGNSTSLLVVE